MVAADPADADAGAGGTMTLETAFLAGLLTGLATAWLALRRRHRTDAARLHEAQADASNMMEAAYFLGVHAQKRHQQRHQQRQEQ